MESTGEDLSLLTKIRPPRLEDAGLEDCALPPDSIHQAFVKAAAAVSSRAASLLSGDDNGGCVADPWPEKSTPSDALIGIAPEGGTPGPCATGKGGASVGEGDSTSDLLGGRNEEEVKKKDEVVVAGGEGGGEGGDCVDGLRGLEIKDNGEKGNDEDDEDEKPTLVEGYILKP